MKNIKYLFFFIILLIIAGCSEDDPVSATGGPGSGIGGIGGGGTTGVVWTIGQTQGTQGGIIFTATPGTAVTITQLTVSLPSENFEESLQLDGQTVYQSGTTYQIEEFLGVASGQKWSFRFVGNIGSAQGQAYDVTSTYSVP